MRTTMKFAAGFAAFAAAACVATAAARPPREPHEMWRKQGQGFLAVSRGRLYGSPTHNCAWLGGRTAGIAIAWPPRYVIRFDPLRIVAASSGRVVAREGDWIRTTGGGSDGQVRGCPNARGVWFPTVVEFWGSHQPPLP